MFDDYAEDNPMALFERWFAQADAHEHIKYANAMNLATADAQGAPSNRIVLLKDRDANSFTFFTNYEGRKSRELRENPTASLCFYWMPLDKQIRVEGNMVRASNEASDAYFATRPRLSQIGAWASQQSEAMERFEQLQERVDALEEQYKDKPVPRPPHWGGWSLIPTRMEFWYENAFRLHHRWVYIQTDTGWQKGWLYP